MASDDRQLAEERSGKRKNRKNDETFGKRNTRERENVVKRIGFVGVFSPGVL